MIPGIVTLLRHWGHVWDILGHGWDIGGTFVGHRWDICALTWPWLGLDLAWTCLGLVLDLSWTCHGFVLEFFYEKDFGNVLKVTENGNPVGSIFNDLLSFCKKWQPAFGLRLYGQIGVRASCFYSLSLNWCPLFLQCFLDVCWGHPGIPKSAKKQSESQVSVKWASSEPQVNLKWTSSEAQ